MIIKYVQPDIFKVNEMDGQGTHAEADDANYLLKNALNVDGVNYYRKTNFPKVYLANTLFYNSNKLVLKSHSPISLYSGGYPKIFNVYTFCFNSDDLEMAQDMAFFSCLVVFLKAGNKQENLDLRAYEATQIMNYYESLGKKGNYLLMGDFSVYTPNEECSQSFINPDNGLYTFSDPANQIGEWSVNYDYRYYHTQFTCEIGDCFAGGGMDDCFDFILASDYIMNGLEHYTSVDSSYKVIGQDGSRYNSNLNISSNTVVPNDVAKALCNMSDHLPVYMEIQVDQNQGEPLRVNGISNQLDVSYQNPVNGELKLTLQNFKTSRLDVEIASMNGSEVFKKECVNTLSSDFEIPLANVLEGMYILHVK